MARAMNARRKNDQIAMTTSAFDQNTKALGTQNEEN